MPKIKTLNNDMLRNYLEAYTTLHAVEPNNSDCEVKIKAINLALNNREKVGYDVPEKSFIQRLTGLFTFNKKK